MHDLAQSGSRFLSFLIVNAHMVGIAFGALFSRRAWYSPRVILQNVPKLSIPRFSCISFPTIPPHQDVSQQAFLEASEASLYAG